MDQNLKSNSGNDENAALRELQHCTLEALELGVLLVNAQGTVQLTNSAFRTIYGLEDLTFPGMGWADFQESPCFREADPTLQEILPRCFDLAESGFLEEYSIQRPSPRRIAILAKKATDRTGRPLGKISLHADVTRNWEIQQQMLEHTRELERANLQIQETQSQLIQAEKMACLGVLVAGIAHEINTPMGAINSNSDILERLVAKIREILDKPEFQGRTPDLVELRKLLELIYQTAAQNQMACERIMLLVRGLRNYTRLDEADRKKADLHEGIESTLILVHHQLKNRIQVVREYGELPEILCYPNQLNQVFLNLFVNAAHAMPEGGTLSIRTRAEAGQVRIEVHDTGVGIPPENLTRIFEPGFTTKRMGIGTGLGLAISGQIVRDHAGKIEVRSEPSGGTAFILTLPIQ